VEHGNRVHLRNVTLGENLGAIVQITSGLSASDKLVNNPPAGLLEGQRIEQVTPAPGYAPAPPPPGAASGDGHATTP